MDRALWRLRALVRPPVTLGVRGLVVDGERILLVRHTYKEGWHFPGGGVDPGESAREAMAREVLEETGVAVEGESRLFHLYWNRRLAGRDHVALYVAERFRPAPAGFRAAAEIAEAGFFALSALPEGVTAATARRIVEVFSGAAVDDLW